jgi:hypothetical protein
MVILLPNAVSALLPGLPLIHMSRINLVYCRAPGFLL